MIGNMLPAARPCFCVALFPAFFLFGYFLEVSNVPFGTGWWGRERATQPPLYRGKLFACGTGLEPVGRFACETILKRPQVVRYGGLPFGRDRMASRGLTAPTDGNNGRWSHTPESGKCGRLQIDFDPSDGGHPQPTFHQTL